VFDMAMHVALGWEYRGRRVTPGPIVYCALEGAAGFRARVEAFRQHRLAESAEEPSFYLMATPLNLVADHKAFVSEIRAQLGSISPAAIVIDTLNRSLAGSESDDKDMAAYVRASDAIRDAFNCLAVIIHHCGHNGDRPRGHSSLMGALDVQIAVRRDAAQNVVAELELSKDGPTGDTIVSRLEPVSIGVDADGDAITSCIIEPIEDVSASPKRQANLSKGAQIALRALQDAISECGFIPPASNHVPNGTQTVTVEQWRDYSYRWGISDSPLENSKLKAFGRAHEALVAAQRVGAWYPHVWLT
jgi:hypothetical protein